MYISFILLGDLFLDFVLSIEIITKCNYVYTVYVRSPLLAIILINTQTISYSSLSLSLSSFPPSLSLPSLRICNSNRFINCEHVLRSVQNFWIFSSVENKFYFPHDLWKLMANLWSVQANDVKCLQNDYNRFMLNYLCMRQYVL